MKKLQLKKMSNLNKTLSTRYLLPTSRGKKIQKKKKKEKLKLFKLLWKILSQIFSTKKSFVIIYQHPPARSSLDKLYLLQLYKYASF